MIVAPVLTRRARRAPHLSHSYGTATTPVQRDERRRAQ